MTKKTENEIKDENLENMTAETEVTTGNKKEKKKVKAEKSMTKNPVEADEDTLKISVLVAELLGTFVLTGAVIKLLQQGTTGIIGIAFVLLLLVIVFGKISETYFNPAIAVGLLINRKIDVVKAIAYIIAQVIGALLALLVFHAIWKAGLNGALTSALTTQGYGSQVEQAGGLAKFAAAQNMTLEQMAEKLGLGFVGVTVAKGNEWVAFAAELIGALIFGLGIGHAVYGEKDSAAKTGLSIAFGLFGGLAVGGTTVILNPAVAAAIGAFQWGKGLGSMTFWVPIFIYILGTIIGMAIGITAYRFIREKALDVNVF